MELKLDLKTLVIGIALGVIVALAIGSGSVYYPPFATPIKPDGTALVKTQTGHFYIINPLRAMASQVLEADVKSHPGDALRSPGNEPFTDNSPSGSR